MHSAFDNTSPLLPAIMDMHGRWLADHPALMFEGDTLSWAAFNERTNQIGNALAGKGLQPGDMIGVVMSNTADTVCTLFGIAKAGLCSVPINLSVTDDAMFAMLENADVKALCITADQQGRFHGNSNLPDICIVADGEAESFITLDHFISGAVGTLSACGVTDNDPMNVIYSSGTTGLPKGIVHTYKGRRDWAYDLSIALGFHRNVRMLFNIGLYSNISWAGMLNCVLTGACMVIHRAYTPEGTFAEIQNSKVTHIGMVPIQFQRCLEAESQAEYDLSSLQMALTVGSPMHEDLKVALQKRLGTNVLMELYGLTEGIITTLAPEEMMKNLGSVGKPLIGQDIILLDDNDNIVPAGEKGEIVGRARYVMPGYLNRPDATAEASYTDKNGNVWLRTGDIGIQDEKGFLYIVDRKKDMILSGGQNIYPQDIEAAIIKHEAVNDVAVIGGKSEKWGETPVAIVVLESGKTTDANTLKNWTNERVGKQQRIAAVEFIDLLPRNPNGKILKRELREQFNAVYS